MSAEAAPQGEALTEREQLDALIQETDAAILEAAPIHEFLIPAAQFLAQALPHIHDGSILSVGCGNSEFSKLLADATAATDLVGPRWLFHTYRQGA
jgi:hypothetical protein